MPRVAGYMAVVLGPMSETDEDNELWSDLALGAQKRYGF